MKRPIHSRLRLLALLFWASPVTGGGAAIEFEELLALPAPFSNNAVALSAGANGVSLFSFFGLESGKSWRDLSNRGWLLRTPHEAWAEMDEIPDATGRLASVAVTVAGEVWLFGGYTVAEDGAEESTSEVFRIEPESGTAAHVSDMPVPVDDMTAFAYRDRYVYLVSGWHDLGNVNLVQVLDTRTLQWAQATPYPGAPVFGHAGGMSGDMMLVCGGVRIEYPQDGSARQFLPSEECWKGIVDTRDFRRVAWEPVDPHPGPPLYRAAGGVDDRGRIVFAGGSSNPYNYDGVGYNGEPSEPEAAMQVFDLDRDAWLPAKRWPGASMDHRNLPFFDGWFYLVGGMLRGQELTRRVLRFRLEAAVEPRIDNSISQ